jgi:transmembrane 9 superfamily protein 2/4
MKTLYKVVTTFVISLGLPLTSAFYLPGVAPHDYKKGELVTLNVNSLTPSSAQQVKSVISYDFYNEQFHFCQPKDGKQEKAESIGSILFGDRIFNSPFEVCIFKVLLLLYLNLYVYS